MLLFTPRSAVLAGALATLEPFGTIQIHRWIAVTEAPSETTFLC